MFLNTIIENEIKRLKKEKEKEWKNSKLWL